MKKWQTTTLGDICDIINGRNQKEVLDTNGAYPVYGSAGNLMGLANKYICEAGTVIIGRKGNISTPHFITEKFWNVDTAFGIYPKNEVMLPRFNYYQCLNIDFASRNKGTTIPSLVKSDLITIVVSYPTDLKEQQQIVEKLDTAFDLIDRAKANIEKNIHNAKELFQSKLNQVFSEKGEGWEEKKLADFYLIKHGYAFDGKLFEISENKDLPIVLTPGNYHENGGLYFTKKNTKRTHAKYPLDFLFDAGDLTVVMTDLSSKMKILGLPAIIESCNILHNQRIGKFISKGNDEHFDKKFLYYFLKSKKYLNNIKLTATGTMVKHTAPGRILDNKINFPSSLDQQKEIVSQLDQLSAQTELLQQKYQQKLANLEELKKSILEKAFKGQLN